MYLIYFLMHCVRLDGSKSQLSGSLLSPPAVQFFPEFKQLVPRAKLAMLCLPEEFTPPSALRP